MGCNISSRRNAEAEVNYRMKGKKVAFKIIHKEGTGGWKHAVAVDSTTGTVIRDGSGEVLSAYRPIVGDR